MTKPSYEERRITKHSGSPQIADSAPGTESSSMAKETRKPGERTDLRKLSIRQLEGELRQVDILVRAQNGTIRWQNEMQRWGDRISREISRRLRINGDAHVE